MKQGRLFGVLVLCGGMLIAACSNKGPAAPKEGRQSISLVKEATVTATRPIRVGKAVTQDTWKMAFQNAENNRVPVLMNKDIKKARRISVGSGVSSEAVTIATPVVINGLVYAMDSAFRMRVIDLKTGREEHRIQMPEVKGTTAKSVGLAIDKDVVYAVAGNGLVVAVSVANGKILWQRMLKAPLRSSPVISRGRLFVSSINNDLFALDIKSGKELWHYRGEPAVTNFFGMGTVATDGTIVVMPTTTGRVNAFDAATGVLIWTETMWAARTYNPLLDLPHVIASPVIQDGIVYLIGNASKMGAYRLTDGSPVFTADIGGQETPAFSGDALFMISNQNQLLALNRKTGDVYWKTDLTSTDKATWYGPLIINEQAIVVSNTGDLVFFDLKTGNEVRRENGKAVVGAPIAVSNALILLTADGDLQLYQ